MSFTTTAYDRFAPLPIESRTASDELLESLTASLARGGAADGAQVIERALALNVQWERLTKAVQEGIDLGYERPTVGDQTAA